MKHYRLSNGASGGGTSGGGSFWDDIGNFFSGFDFSGFNFPSNNGLNIQPIQFPNYQKNISSINPIYIIGGVIAAIVIIKLIND